MPPSRRAADPAAFKAALATAALLGASALALLHPAPRAAIGRRLLAPVVFWGLPMLAGLLAAALFRRRATGGETPASTALPTWSPESGAFPRLLVPCAAAFALDQGFLGAGHLLGWITFTYGEQRLVSHPLWAAAWGLPLCLLMGVACYERALRGGILAGASARLGVAGASALSIATGVIMALPGILLGTPFADPPYVASALLTAACREAASCVIVLSGGGLLLAGLYRGWMFYFEGFLLNDVNALVLPMANYTSSEPRLYLLRAALAVAAILVLALGGAWARRLHAPRPQAPGLQART